MPDPLEHRVAALEDITEDHQERLSAVEAAAVRLEATLGPMKASIDAMKEAGIRSDAARDRQTEILAGKIDAVRDRALTAVPTWAMSTITLLGMAVAALMTALFTR